MDVKEKKVESQIETWAILGPLITLMTLLVTMMKPAEELPFFSLSLLVGLLACWKWKLRGFAFSAAMPLLYIAYSSIGGDLSEILWGVGLAAASTLSFLVTALSFDEVEALTKSLQIESKSRLENLLKLDEKHKQESKISSKSQEELQGTIAELKRELALYREGVVEKGKLEGLVRGELSTAKERIDELHKELFDAKNLLEKREEELAALKEESGKNSGRVERAELDLAYEEIAALEKEAACLNEQLALFTRELENKELLMREAVKEGENFRKEREALSLELKGREEELAELKRELQERESLSEKVQKLDGEIELLRERNRNLELSLGEREAEISLEKEKYRELHSSTCEREMLLQQIIHEAKRERESLESGIEKQSKKESSELRIAKGQLSQLQKQFQEKSDVLDETRRAIFHMQEKLLLAQRELDEARKRDKSDAELLLEETIAKMEKERIEVEKSHQREIDDLHEIIGSLSTP